MPPSIPGMELVATLPLRSRRVLTAAGALLVPVGLTSLGLYWAHPGPPDVARLPWTLTAPIGLLALVVTHEALHVGAARYLAGIPWIRIRLRPAGLGLPVCVVDGRSSVASQRRVGATPVVVTSAACAAWLVVGGSAVAAALLTCAVVLSAGDLVMLGQLRRFRADDLVLSSDAPRALHVYRVRPAQADTA